MIKILGKSLMAALAVLMGVTIASCGDANEFARWVNSQLKYPEQAIKDQVEGRVLIQFTIGTDGAVSDVKLLRGVREDLDAEALKIVASSPKWEPGQQNGKAVPVHFNFPVVYKLQ